MTPATAKIVPGLLTLFVGWRVYMRFRRNIGRQPLQPKRMKARIVIFSVISLLIVLGAFSFPSLLLGFGGGLLLGIPLALVGLRLTRFETTTEGHFYTPNTHIGLAISLMLAGRVAYRIATLYLVSSDPTQPAPSFLQSPLTLGMIGITAGYYIIYFSGVLRHRRDKV